MTADWLRKVDDGVAALENQFLWISHAVIATLVVTAVFFRYVLSDPLIWTEEFIVIVFSWLLFIGFASGFRERMHLRIDALLILLPRKARFGMGVIALLATAVTLVGLLWFGLDQARQLLETQTPMMRVSAAWATAALPVGALFSCLHILRHAICDGLDQTLWPEDLVAASTEEDV
jgi:TRAP-type C4-dicarboxylate transport system permease small subunit